MTNQINIDKEGLLKSLLDRHVLRHSMDEFHQENYEYHFSELCKFGDMGDEGTQRVINYIRENVKRM